MGIKPTFTRQDIQRRFDDFLNQMVVEQVDALKRLGAECVSIARDKTPSEGGFNDRSGNLRSSIGFIVFVDGEPQPYSPFTTVNPKEQRDGDVYDGAKRGEELALSIGKQHPQGVCLVCVAGMNYALYVEAKGRDVLTSAKRHAEETLPNLLHDLLKDIKSVE